MAGSVEIMNVMRPLNDKGVRFESLADMLLELHSQEYTIRYARYEYDVMKERKQIGNPDGPTYVDTHETFSLFGDKDGYCGKVPTGRYLEVARKMHHEMLRAHFDREVKKRGAERLAFDVSYKEAKSLSKYHGESIFSGLATFMNELGEVRAQHHVISDSHEQLLPSIQAFHHTTKEFGQPPLKHFSTDNPGGDKAFIMEQFPSLREEEAKYNSTEEECAPDPEPEEAGFGCYPYFPYDPECVRVAETAGDMNDATDAMLETAKRLDSGKVVLGFDTETEVELNDNRFPAPANIRSRRDINPSRPVSQYPEDSRAPANIRSRRDINPSRPAAPRQRQQPNIPSIDRLIKYPVPSIEPCRDSQYPASFY